MSAERACPHCGTGLDGDLIFDTFMKMYEGNIDKALRTAEMYGATDKNGMRWKREIALYSLEMDRTYAYRCPDCHQTWERK